MLDLRWIRNNEEKVRSFLASRNNDFDIGPMLALDLDVPFIELRREIETLAG